MDIGDAAVDIVPHMKFLGFHIANILTWSMHISSTVKKAQPVLPAEANTSSAQPISPHYFLQRCHWECANQQQHLTERHWGERWRLQRGSLGVMLPPLGDLAEQQRLSRTTRITEDHNHPSLGLFSLQKTGLMLTVASEQPRCFVGVLSNLSTMACPLSTILSAEWDWYAGLPQELRTLLVCTLVSWYESW